MGPEVLVPLSSMALVIAIVGIVQAGRTVRYYLDWRMRLAERQLGGKDPSLVKAIQDLQAEIAALRRHEAEAVLSFDSTLHALDARMKHLELRSLGEGEPERPVFGAASRISAPPPQPAIKSG